MRFSKVLLWLLIDLLPTLGCGSTEMQAPAESLRHPQIGVCTHFGQTWDPEVLMPLVAELGVSIIRDGVYWTEIEPTRGTYRIPEKTHRWVEAAHCQGLGVIVTFARANSVYDDPFDAEAYAKAASYVAEQLRGRILAIEVFNEPNNQAAGFRRHFGGEWSGIEPTGQLSPWVVAYVKILNATAKAVKAVAPEVKVIGLGANTWTNFDQLLLGVSPQVDGISAHPYSSRTPPELLGKQGELLKLVGMKEDAPGYRELAGLYAQGTFAGTMEAYRLLGQLTGQRRELWLTEWGYSTWVAGRRANPGSFLGYTEEAQAIYTQRRLIECLGLGVECSVVYDFFDDGDDRYEVENNFGLVRRDLSRKPAFGAIQRIVREMARLRAQDGGIKLEIASKDDKRGPFRHYQFLDHAGQPVFAIWSAEALNAFSPRLADLTLTSERALAPGIELVDLYTGAKTVMNLSSTASGFHVALEIPSHPILLRLRFNP